MSSPENRGGEPENLWTQYSRLRIARRAELLTENPNISQRQMTRMLWGLVPVKEGKEVSIVEHTGSDPGMSQPHDVKDAFELEAEDPQVDELEKRIEANRRAFQQGDS